MKELPATRLVGPLAVLETALEATAGGMLLVDREGAVVRANPEALRILGVPASGLEGKRLDDWLRVAEVPIVAPGPLVGTALRTGQSARQLVTIARPGSAPVLARARVVPAPDEHGHVAGALVGLEEQTPEPEAVQIHRRAEASMRALMDHSPDPMVVHSGGRVIYANAATAKLLGLDSPQEIVGRPVLDLTYPEDRPVVRARVERMLRQDEAVPMVEERFLRKDGGVAWCDVVAFPIVFDGKIAMLAYGHDIAPRRAMEAERQRLLDEQTRLGAEARRRASELQAILDHLSSGLLVIDRHANVTMTNRATAEILGRERMSDFLGPLDRIALQNAPRHLDGRPFTFAELPLIRALNEGGSVQGDMVVRHASGADRFLRVNASPIRGPSGEVAGAVVVLRDVTEFVEFDRLKDQFLRVVAHELKTPVAIMKGYAQVLLRRPSAATAPREMLEKIDRGADRIDRIVRDMLDMSQLHLGSIALELAPLDLADLVTQAADDVRPGLERHRVRVEAAPATVEGDALRLAEVMRILLDNAIRYSPHGGDIEVRLQAAGGRAVVSVRDRGVGIPQAKQARIFDRFYRAHTDTPYDYGGLGVGLFLAREIVRRHGGDMWFESREGEGSTFSFALPLRGEDGR